MLKRDRWRLGIVAIVVVAALVTVFPISGKINLGLDLKGGAHIVLQAKESAESKVTEDSIERLLAVLRNRVDQYGVAEPVIQREGRDRVIVGAPALRGGSRYSRCAHLGRRRRGKPPVRAPRLHPKRHHA